MNTTDLSNYTPIYGRGAEFRRELVEFVRYFQTHPNSALAAKALFDADVAKIQAALTAAGSIPVTSVDLTPATASVVVGATRQLTAVVAPANATVKTVTYSTSDATKATVSASGLVTAVAAGSATITATASGKTDTSVITVTAA